MAPITPAIVLQRLKMKKTNEVMTGTAPRREPVRVKLQRMNAGFSKTHAPDGQGEIWWARLKEALGTSSSDFVNASLFQLQRAAQLPCSGISELAMNASLAMIEAAAPQNEIEGALAVQMACAHSAAIAVLARFGGCGASEARAVALASAAARLMRAFSAQVETLRRLRHGSDQYVRVEHVHVNEGGQTVIGNIRTQGGKRAQLVGNQVMGDNPAEAAPPLPMPDEAARTAPALASGGETAETAAPRRASDVAVDAAPPLAPGGEARWDAPPPAPTGEGADAAPRGAPPDEAAEAAPPRAPAGEVDIDMDSLTERINWVGWLTGAEKYTWLALSTGAQKDFKQPLTSKRWLVQNLVVDRKVIRPDQVCPELAHYLPAIAEAAPTVAASAEAPK